jgi:hypothetical protein
MARLTSIFVGTVVLAGLFYAFTALLSDLQGAHVRSWGPFILLGVALLIALGFEFVNGFHDTANAVATVIYTHAMPPNIAVVWSGFFNFLGVLTSTGVVAFGIISLRFRRPSTRPLSTMMSPLSRRLTVPTKIFSPRLRKSDISYSRSASPLRPSFRVTPPSMWPSFCSRPPASR